ncbi:MAG: hypothetical protein EXX96DRAFT_654344 [Benjaminiella poitrasii]|nr:MAG: hypothetical protein EXX96DRAFT_654344 [Benjaminiella poitrasii]
MKALNWREAERTMIRAIDEAINNTSDHNLEFVEELLICPAIEFAASAISLTFILEECILTSSSVEEYMAGSVDGNKIILRDITTPLRQQQQHYECHTCTSENMGDAATIIAFGTFIWLLKFKLEQAEKVVARMKEEHDNYRLAEMLGEAGTRPSLLSKVNLVSQEPIKGKGYCIFLPIDENEIIK